MLNLQTIISYRFNDMSIHRQGIPLKKPAQQLGCKVKMKHNYLKIYFKFYSRPFPDKSERNNKPAGKSTFRSDRLFGMQSAKSGIKIFQEVHNGHIYALP